MEPDWDDLAYGDYEPDLEDLAYDAYRERQFESMVSQWHEGQRDILASTKPDKYLREISKECRFIAEELAQERFDVATDTFDVELGKTSITVSRTGTVCDKVHRPLTRRDKRKRRKAARKAQRQLRIWSNAGEKSRDCPVVRKTGAFYWRSLPSGTRKGFRWEKAKTMPLGQKASVSG